MVGKGVLLVNLIFSLLIFVMFLPVFDGYFVGFMISGVIVLFAIIAIYLLILGLIYATRVIFKYKVFGTATGFEKILLLWPYLQVAVWLIFLLKRF